MPGMKSMKPWIALMAGLSWMGGGARAQQALTPAEWNALPKPPCLIQFQICTGDTPPWPSGTVFLDDGLPTICKPALAPSNQCVPPAAVDETAPGPHCPGCEAGQPINLATGNTYIVQTDLRVPGRAGGLALTRTWNSRWPASQSGAAAGRFGLNWRSSYEEQLAAGGDGSMKYAREDGSFWSFEAVSAAKPLVYQPAAPANGGALLTPGASVWTLTFRNGEQRLFDNASGLLTAVVDRNGNATQLAYDGQNRLATVTGPALGHLFFSYAGSSPLVSGVTSDAGLSLGYAYDAQGRLAQVTQPDLTTISFQYDASSNITAVLDASGKVLEQHAYDSGGRALTSSRAAGADALTVVYQPGP